MQRLRFLPLGLFSRNDYITHRFAPLSISLLIRSWDCMSCNFTNSDKVKECKRCEISIDDPSNAKGNLLQWKCECGTFNALLSCRCRNCDKEPSISDETIEEEPETETVSNTENLVGRPWICFCGVQNLARDKKCTNCAQTTSEMALQMSSRNEDDTHKDSHKKSEQSSEDKKDFWTCSCGAINRAYRSECSVCRESVEPEVQRSLLKAAVENEQQNIKPPDRPPKFNETPDWPCPSCSYLNYGSRLECRQCGRSKVGQNLFNNESIFQPLDWVCGGCSFSNFASRQECHRCKRSKRDQTETEKTEKKTAEPVEDRNFHKQISKSRPKSFQSDWTYPECAYVNFNARMDCRRCGTKNSSLTEKHEKNKNPYVHQLWPCTCGEQNYMGAHHCSTCLAKRPLVYAVPGDWICFCGYLNFTSRNACLRCTKPKESNALELEEGLSCTPWRCHACNNPFINKPVHFKCSFCLTRRMISNQMRNWRCQKCNKSNSSDRLICRQCGSKKEESEGNSTEKTETVKRKVWKCPHCQNVNQDVNENCVNCDRKKEIPLERKKTSISENLPRTSVQQRKTADSQNPSKVTHKVVNQKNTKRTNAKSGKNMRSEDAKMAGDAQEIKISDESRSAPQISGSHSRGPTPWYCVNCRTFNFSHAVQCSRCSESYESSTKKQTKMSPWECRCKAENAGTDFSCHKCGLIRNCPFGQHLLIKAGDWRCECDMVNKVAKRFCSHCRSPRKLIEWKCHCGKSNSTQQTTCEKCHSLPGGGRWICRCGYSNFHARVMCHQCAAMRPHDDFFNKMLQGDVLEKDEEHGKKDAKVGEVRSLLNDDQSESVQSEKSKPITKSKKLKALDPEILAGSNQLPNKKVSRSSVLKKEKGPTEIADAKKPKTKIKSSSKRGVKK